MKNQKRYRNHRLLSNILFLLAMGSFMVGTFEENNLFIILGVVSALAGSIFIVAR